MSAWESIFEFLFKYRPLLFERGDVTFASPWYVFAVAAAALALAVPTVLRYARVRGRTTGRDRALLSAVRAVVFALVLFSLARPVLVLSTVVPQRNFVGVLLDDSRSMRITDVGDAPRGDFILDEFGSEESRLLSGLSDRFIVRFFRFSSRAERVNDPSVLTFSGGKTDVGRALDHARQELASVPLAGLVVVTDGADNTYESLDEPLLALQADAVPVHTVGVGLPTFSKDIELTRVQTPRRVLNGTSLVVDLLVSQYGYQGETVPLVVEDDGRIVSTQDVRLGGDGEAVAVRVHFTVTEPGPRLFTFRVPEQSEEMVGQNNVQEALILVEDRRPKVLYFEGEPRFEVAFTRRAIQDDPNIHVVTLTRPAENKFNRLGVEDSLDLSAGFPKTREELFQYEGLILGSVEASYFTLDQLRMISDFVGQRGGGLLLLGGRRSFERGGFAGTPVEEVMPVVLSSGTSGTSEDFVTEVNIEPTPAGRTHAITQIAESESESADRWQEMPALTVVNPMTEVKPGATTLLRGISSDVSDPLVVLAWERYGRGKSIAFPVQDAWLWQMMLPLEDMTHQTYWRQLLRWLVSFVPDRVSVSTPSDRVAPHEPVTVIAEVEDDRYIKVNNTDVSALVVSPTGRETSLQLEWNVDRDGEYRATFVPEEEGLYEITVDAREDGEFLSSSAAHVHSTDLAREFYDAEMQGTTLRRIAEETGGGFYTPATVASLPEDISYTESGTTVIERNDLWDMPIIFLLVLGLICGEWGYRRLRGLV